MLLSCWNGSLDRLCLGSFGTDDFIAVDVIPTVALGIIYSHHFLQSHTLKEAVEAALPSVFRENHINFMVKPKRMRHDLMVKARYPQAPTSTSKKFMDEPFAVIAKQSDSYFPNLVASNDSMFSSQGQVISKIITVSAIVEYRRILGLHCEIANTGKVTSVYSRSDQRTPSGSLCSNLQLAFCKFLVDKHQL